MWVFDGLELQNLLEQKYPEKKTNVIDEEQNRYLGVSGIGDQEEPLNMESGERGGESNW